MDQQREIEILVYSAIFIAIVFVFTIIMTFATPATRGYFNIGEAGVYLAAFIGGPYIGAIAGGIGSALADLFLGYPIYAPATLVIKGAEGFVVAYLFELFRRRLRGETSKMFILFVTLAIFGTIFISYLVVYMSLGVTSIQIVLESEPLHLGISFMVPIWYVLGFVLIIELLAIVLLFVGKEKLLMIFSCFVGGTIMVFGYFLYESLIFGQSVALIEVIPNYFQVIAGIIISIPVVDRLKKLGVIPLSYRDGFS